MQYDILGAGISCAFLLAEPNRHHLQTRTQVFTHTTVSEVCKSSICSGVKYNLRHERINNQITFARSDKVGIAAGMWFGDPDIDAMERITNRPIVRQFSEILHKGIALENTHFSPVDSQNTAYVRELAPLMMVLVGVGRYDDIWA